MERNKHIETLRGFAILLVITYHICQYLKLPDISIWRQLHIPFDYLRMPLFTVISGFVYALRPIQLETLQLFVQKKFMRLFFPLCSWAIATYVIYSMTFDEFSIPGLVTSIFYPYMQFWFLQVLIFVFAIVVILEFSQLLQHWKSWLASLILSLIALLFYVYIFPKKVTTPLVSMTFFSYSGIFYLLPYFLLGIGIKRFLYMKIALKYIVLLGVVSMIGLVFRELYTIEIIDSANLRKDGIFGMLFGLSSTVFIMSIRIENNLLAFIGSLAYPIYLIHLIGLLIGSSILFENGIYNNIIVFPFMFLSGLILPIVMTLIIDLHPFSRLIFFGTRRKSFIKNLANILETPTR